MDKDKDISQMPEQKKRKKWYIFGLGIAVCGCLAAGIVFFSGGGSSNPFQKNEKISEKDSPGKSTSVKNETDMVYAADYEEIYSYLKAANDADSTEKIYSAGSYVMSTDDLGTEKGAVAGTGYSDTNLRQDGVEEGDVVKTDGKNLYIMSRNQVRIVNIEHDTMQELGKIEADDNDYITEIYLKGNKLMCIYNRNKEIKENQEIIRINSYTSAEVFDVSNPEEPESLGEISQSGSFYTMRVSGDYVYLLSTFYADTGVSRNLVASYVPEVQGKVMESSAILLPGGNTGRMYTVVTTFELNQPKEKVDSIAFFGDRGNCYVSEKNIYVYDSVYNSKDFDLTRTYIRKVSYQDGVLDGAGSVTLEGTIHDSFSIDEYEGNLRIVTTVQENGSFSGGVNPLARSENETSEETADITNSLYILDSNLEELGRIEGLAKGEQVYSARFMGDTGYFVTYKQIDPLFSVDLSDPKHPEILGELKIAGFSDYLHPYGDNLLLGIGMDTDETGTTTNGVKLSMFDIANPEDVQEIQKEVIKGCYSTDVSYNYKAALADTEKNLIGFPGYENTPTYYLYSYDAEHGFTCLLKREMSGYSEVRGLYSKDKFYLVTDGTVESYSLETMEKIDDLVL